MASYPTTTKTFTTKSDGAGNTIMAAHVNDLQSEVTAIEAALLATGLAHHLLFVDATYDIGASGATRPRNVYVSGAVTCGGTLTVGTTLYITGASAVQLNNTGLFQTTWPETANAANANVGNGGYLRLVTSLRSAKFDIDLIPTSEARRVVMALQGVTYRSRVDAEKRPWAGFIADDAEKVNKILVTYDDKGALQSFTYDRLTAYHNVLLQNHEARIAALEAA